MDCEIFLDGCFTCVFFGEVMSEQPWTMRQLLATMRKEGWIRVSTVAREYAHSNHAKVNLDNFDARLGMTLGKWYCQQKKTPLDEAPPF